MAVDRSFGSGHQRPYECKTCGERYRLEYYVCPECGGFSVERTRPGAGRAG